MKAPRFAIFIDGSNFYATLKMVGFPVNYDRIIQYYGNAGIVLEAKYFTALPPKEVHSPLRNICNRLSHNGWTIVSKETKSIITNDGILKLKGNMDVDIAIHALMIHDEVSDFVLFSGDGDFVPVVRILQSRNVRVHVISHHSYREGSCMVAAELMDAASNFTDLADLREEFEYRNYQNRRPPV